MEGRKLVVGERFCGPPGMGNGGYVAGLLATAAGGRAEVDLRRPIPIGVPLVLRREGQAWRLAAEAGREPLVEARPVESVPPLLAPSPAPDFELAVRASGIPPKHPFPRCFVCGPERAEGDGLRVFAGPVRPGCFEVVAAPWIPDASLCSDGEHVDAHFLWAALDCPGAMVAMEDDPRPVLLARMTGGTQGRVRHGERCVVIGWRIGREGRKHACGTALYGADGTLRGASEQLWIEPRPPAPARA